jgi:hypothetical protein
MPGIRARLGRLRSKLGPGPAPEFAIVTIGWRDGRAIGGTVDPRTGPDCRPRIRAPKRGNCREPSTHMATLVYRNGRPRLHRSVWRNGRVTTVYLGSGRLAELMAEADRLERGHRATLRQLDRVEARERAEADRRLEAAVAGVVADGQALARQVLERAGYRQHNRGAWRKQRGGRAVAEREIRVARPQDVKRMDAWSIGNLAKALAGKTNQEVYDQLMEEFAAVQSEIAGPAPSPIEEHLAYSITAAWGLVRWYEAQLAGNLREGSVATIDYLQRSLDRATRRHLAVLRTLAMVRRLAVPAIQVNLAQQQVNVAGARTSALAPAPQSGASERT